jgi:membrane protease YdiL (CAAX protease family)
MPNAIPLLLWAALSVLAAVWVHRDAHARGRGELATFWAIGTLLFAGIALPYYVLVVRPVRPEDAGWDLAEVTAVAVLFFAAPLLTAPLFFGGGGLDFSLPYFAAAILAQSAVLIGGSAHVVVRRHGRTLGELGFLFSNARAHAASAALWSIPLVAAVNVLIQPAVVAILGLFMGAEAARTFAEREEASNPILRALPASTDFFGITVFALLVCVIVPIAEETFFRGLLHRTLSRRAGIWRGTAISAALFSAAHGQIVNFLPIFLLGYALAIAYERTGSLVAPITIHVMTNFVALFGAYYGKSP